MTGLTIPPSVTMRTKLIKRLCPAVLIAVAAMTSCDRHPAGVLGQEEMAQLLADLDRAEVVVETNTRTYNDSLRRVLRQSVYARHGVTSAEVDSSLSWYGYNMDRYLKVHERTIEILEEDLKKAQEKAASSAASDRGASDTHMMFEGDSVDVWESERFRRLNVRMPSQIISFRYNSDPNWETGDTYTLRQKHIGTTSPVEVTMVAEYPDGTTDYLTRSLSGEGWHDVRFETSRQRKPRYVYGTISYRGRSGDAYIDSISMTRTRMSEAPDELMPQRVQHFRLR